MIGAILRKEALSILRDGRLLLLAVSLFAVLLGFFLAATQEYRHMRNEKQAAGETVRAQWEAQGVKGTHQAAHFGIYVFKPESPLAAIDPGLRQFTGQALWLEPHKRNLARFSPAADQGIATRFGQMSAAFVLHTLLPLLIVALAFNAVTHEREQGTLRMLHSLGLSARKLLFGKFFGLLLAFTLLLLPSLLIGIFLLFGVSSVGSDDILRGVVLGFAYLLYYGIFAALAMAASAWLKSSRLAFFVLVAFWLSSVLVAPRVGAIMAEALVPIPSATQFWASIQQDIEHGLNQDGDSTTRLKAFEAQTLHRYGVKRVEDLPEGFHALRRYFKDAYSNRVHALHFDRLWDSFERQGTFMRSGSLLGPSIAMRALSMSLSMTDFSQQRHFENAAEAYRQYFVGLTDMWDWQRTRGTEVGGQGSAADWRSVDRFEYRAPPLSFALQASRMDIAVLLFWALAAAVALLISARKLTP